MSQIRIYYRSMVCLVVASFENLFSMYDSAIVALYLMMPSAFCSDPSLLFIMYFLFATSLISFGDYLLTFPF